MDMNPKCQQKKENKIQTRIESKSSTLRSNALTVELLELPAFWEEIEARYLFSNV